MKKSEEFILKEMGGNYILVPYGDKSIDFNGIVTLNDTAKYLWAVANTEFTETDLVNALLTEYDVDEARAKESVKNFIESLTKVGAIE